MRSIYSFILILILALSEGAFCKVKFEKAIGVIYGMPYCKFQINLNGEIVCHEKSRSSDKFPIKGVRNINESVVQRILPGLKQVFIYGFKNGSYKLAYIWDTVAQKSVVFDHLKYPHLEGLTMPLYMKAFLKDSYEVRYFWYKPSSPGTDRLTPITKALRSFNFTSEHNVDLFDKPNGKIINHISGDKIKNYKIDFSHSKGKELGPHSTEEHMLMNSIVLDSKYDKNELWFKVNIPLTETYDELDFVILKEHGKVPTSITFKQTIFNEEKIGWFKVFDEDGFFVFR